MHFWPKIKPRDGLIKKEKKVGAELCQAQVKLEVVDEDEVKVRS